MKQDKIEGPSIVKTPGPEGRQPHAPARVVRNGPKTAKAGEPVKVKALTKLQKRFPNISGTIQPKPENASPSGQWACADCGDAFRNNLEAHGHTKTHRLAWWTGVHLEEP